jgi:hypothetical protein
MPAVPERVSRRVREGDGAHEFQQVGDGGLGTDNTCRSGTFNGSALDGVRAGLAEEGENFSFLGRM